MDMQEVYTMHQWNLVSDDVRLPAKPTFGDVSGLMWSPRLLQNLFAEAALMTFGGRVDEPFGIERLWIVDGEGFVLEVFQVPSYEGVQYVEVSDTLHAVCVPGRLFDHPWLLEDLSVRFGAVMTMYWTEAWHVELPEGEPVGDGPFHTVSTCHPHAYTGTTLGVFGLSVPMADFEEDVAVEVVDSRFGREFVPLPRGERWWAQPKLVQDLAEYSPDADLPAMEDDSLDPRAV